MPRRSAAAVADSRGGGPRDIAVRRASIDGLEGLTIGRLADEVAMSKSGLHGMFGTKGELQAAAFERGVEDFTREVWEPVAARDPGLPRLLALIDRWIAYHRRRVLPGGCLVTTATVEFDARPGPLRDAVAETMRRWLETLEREAQAAIDAGELPADANAADIAFELNALAAAASYGFQLWRDPEVFAKARRAMRRTLGHRRWRCSDDEGVPACRGGPIRSSATMGFGFSPGASSTPSRRACRSGPAMSWAAARRRTPAHPAAGSLPRGLVHPPRREPGRRRIGGLPSESARLPPEHLGGGHAFELLHTR